MHADFPVKYQFQPAQPWRVVLIGLAVILALFLPPMVVSGVVGESELKPEPVVLSSALDMNVEKPVLIDDRPLECPSFIDSALLYGYKCGSVYLESIVYPKPEDSELMLRRMVRAASVGFADAQADVTTYGDTLVLVDEAYEMVGFLAPLEEEKVMYVHLDVEYVGAELTGLLEATWQSLHSEPLPAELKAQAESLSYLTYDKSEV